MQINELVGKLVLFKLSEDLRQHTPLFQIYKDELWAMVTGVDDLGVWIQNPAYELGVWWDEKGNLIPPEKQSREKVKTDMLVFWRYIIAMMSVDDERFQRIKTERMPGFQLYR